jgi:hypothetical protein
MSYRQRGHRTISHVLAGLLLSVALAATAGAQTTVSFFDGTFASGWTGSVVGLSGGTAQFTTTTHASGGNPGAWLQEKHTLDGDNLTVLWANFNPANTFIGTLVSLGYSYELQDPGAHAIYYFIAVQQNGTFPVILSSAVEWMRVSPGRLRRTHFS